MAAGRLPKPGTKLGPCTEPCKHKDCAETWAMAEGRCSYCDQAIGFGTRFYRRPNVEMPACDHAACVEDAVTKEA